MSNTEHPLRLRKKHGTGASSDKTAADGERLINAQSMHGAVVAGFITIIVFSVLWVSLSSLTNRVFPWMTVILGYMLGFAVRRAGRGVDLRFPITAAALALAGSLLANIIVAAATTADSFDIGTLEILRSVTSMTWPVFFDESLNAADAIFAIIAAALAAFFASRRLSRSQYYALRLWREEQQDD